MRISAIVAGFLLGIAFSMYMGEMGETVFRAQPVCNPLLLYTCEP